ncbi:hypothetical protein MTO96_013299 [Rhipicephalus appendiculatus]
MPVTCQKLPQSALGLLVGRENQRSYDLMPHLRLPDDPYAAVGNAHQALWEPQSSAAALGSRGASKEPPGDRVPGIYPVLLHPRLRPSQRGSRSSSHSDIPFMSCAYLSNTH